MTVVVHPIDPEQHRGQSGWRWAVMVGDAQPADLDQCVGAGQEQHETAASVWGEVVGAAATKALRKYGQDIRYAYLRLGYDPLPPEADHRPIGVWRGEPDQGEAG